MKNNTKNLYKTLGMIIITTGLISCGSGSDASKETQFYKKKEVIPEKLEVNIEASRNT